MADYFTKFSVVLKLNPNEQQYALDLAAKASDHRFSDEPLPDGLPVELAEVLEDWGFETKTDDQGIWLHSEEGGIDAACAFIQHLLQRFYPDGRVTFEWSFDCSKPRVDAYGGGAAIITAHDITSINTSAWLQSVAA